MFVCSSRLSLFNGLSLFHHRPLTLLRLPPLYPLSAVPHHLLPPSRGNSRFLSKSSQQFHSQSSSNTLQENNHVLADAYPFPPSHPWPEWSDFLESISNSGFVDLNRKLKDEFVPNESLSMEFLDAACSCLGFAHDTPDILGWLPKDDIQVLIDDGAPFLFKNSLETERRMRSFIQGEESNATTVDLMKYILSYASNPMIYPERNIREATESSARNLLREMANLSSRGAAFSMRDIEKFDGAGEDGQTPRNVEPNSKMRRGDWICVKCSFVNFSKNTKCLECDELRPQRQLTGSEWDCPRCNFFNHGKNVVCLKCECRRPGEVPLTIGQMKTPPARQLMDSQSKNIFSDKNKNPEPLFNGNLDQFYSNTSTVQETYPKSTSRGEDARKDGRLSIPSGNNSGYAPFVPLPADMFAEKSENMKIHNKEEAVPRSSGPKATVSVSNSENSATKVKSQNKDAAEEEKSERWFKKVAELHDVTDLGKAISDEDFPEIMPMRKGENRFVVSKKKDRSLTSPKYQRQQAMEQGSSSNFVPFVPFPPDYFAKKDEKQQSKNMSPAVTPADETPSSKATHDMNLVQETRNEGSSSTGISNSRPTVDNGGASSSNKIANSSSTQMNRSRTIPEIEKVRNGWEGKSLEGSAVKETDPLDMSEEAKAERWFRRVAQIKDISEFSQIPDEDFPSIMPMRKGVNRFVVSKRKTPLERRLTSPQYRKNLPSVSSEPTEKEGDGS